MLKLLLKIRDKFWYYTNQLYPNDTPESNLKDFKLRFSMFFLPPVILLIGASGWFCSVVLNKPQDINPFNYFIVLPLSALFWFLFWKIYSRIYDIIAVYPFDKRNDSGYLKNGFFTVLLVLSEITLVFDLIYFLFKIRI